jgi:biopolymer transport protein ExbD
MTEVNIIPVIDISLVLLVILFVTAPLLSYPNVPVDLPLSSAKESQDRTVTVTYTKDGRLAVGPLDSNWNILEAQVRRDLERLPGATLVLRADKASAYRDIQRLLASAKNAGAAKISLATDSK